MAKQYWVDEFYVDLSRNQISQLGESQTLPPKALLVLTYLAENRGRVVSYEELLDTVWANSVVTPNTLQRSIAQLRKALGENSKAQAIIKTHAKQGYSLECDVTWTQKGQPVISEEVIDEDPEVPAVQTEAQSEQHQVTRQPSFEKAGKDKRFLLTAVILVFVVVAYFFQGQKNTPELTFGDYRYLTSTDDKEFGAIYTADGEHILFRRYFEKICINHIWAKDAKTLEETRLTAERGTYDGHSLSPNGENLVFIKQEDCTKPLTQNECYTLMTLNFNEALREPQSPEELLHCQNSAIRKPLWLDDNHIAMLQKEDASWRLIRFSVNDKKSDMLFEVEGGNILHYTFSVEHNSLALITVKPDGKRYIEMLTPDGELVSSHPIRLHETMPSHAGVFPIFVPDSELLSFAVNSHLYTLSREGNIRHLDTPVERAFGASMFHPDGSRLLLVIGRYDSDVGTMPLPAKALTESELQPEPLPISILSRSIEYEDYAKFQPDSDAIAVASERTGHEQIWMLRDGNQALFSDLPKGTNIRNLYWDKAGQNLLILADRELILFPVDGTPLKLNFPYPVTNLFNWESEANTAMANILINGIAKFVSINLNTLEYDVINSKKVIWAAKDITGTLVFLDHMERYWQRGTLEDELIEPLEQQGAEKRFVIRDGVLFGINSEDQLWSYHLESGVHSLLANVPADIDFITDISDDQLLVTVLVTEKKEVIELDVSR